MRHNTNNYRYCQIDYHIRGYFYTLTAYDLEVFTQKEIISELAKQHGIPKSHIEIIADTIEYY